MADNKLKVDLSQGVKKLEIFTKRLVTTRLTGRYKTKIKGYGLEFESYRPYTQEDDASQIDWKASVRINKPIIKEFAEERNLDVFILVDVSSSMVFGSTSKLKNEYAAELVSLLSYAILNAGDSLGYGFFSDKIFDINKPSRKTNLFYIISRSLVNPYIYGGGFDLASALDKLIKLLKKNSILIIVSDFIGLKGDWATQLKKASYKFDTIGIMVRDPRDRELPEDSYMVRVSDPFSEEELIIDSNPEVREKYKRYVKKQEEQIENAFRQHRASLLNLSTSKPFFIPLIQFFKKRKKWQR